MAWRVSPLRRSGARGDKRFSPKVWEVPPFSALSQAFLLQEQWWREAAHGVRGVSRHHEDLVGFTLRQWLDMWSPSNFIATNPQVQQHTLAAVGTNLVTGFANWSRDALAVLGNAKPRGIERFLPGKAVALTPGKVVFRNRLIELIQYEPTTPSVHVQPLLIVPSWIMKYYILDLTPDDSLVKYLVGAGHTVFMVSWRNPGSEDRDLGMEDYLQLGVMAAVNAVRKRCPDTGIHAAGYCLGGTLLAIAAALLGARAGNPIKTVTLLASEVDFHEPGELGLFIDESQIAFLEDLTMAHPQASYRFDSHADGAAPIDAQAWFDAAPMFAGSWWPCWDRWLDQHSAGKVKAQPVLGLIRSGKQILAPGTYVHQE